MKRLGIAFLILFILLVFSVCGFIAYRVVRANTTETPQEVRPLDAMKIEGLVNGYREQNGLPRLTHDDKLCELAELRAEEISKDYSHAGVEARFGTFSYKRLSENIVAGRLTDFATFSSWKGSPSHNAGMLDPLVDKTCVAVNGTYVVQLFIKY